MRKLLTILCIGLAVCLVSSSQVKAQWSVSENTMRVLIQERAMDVQGWLLTNLTDEQRSQFESFLLPPPPSNEDKVMAMKQAITLLERAKADTTSIKQQIDALSNDGVALEPVKAR